MKTIKSFTRKILPATKWVFPMENPAETQARKTTSQSGIALIISILAISMIMIFSSNMIINSQVNLEIAVQARDNLKSEYMAKSAFNMAIFLLSADWGIDLFLASPNSPAKSEPIDGAGDIWNMLNGIPIGGDTVDLIAQTQENFSLSAVNDDNVLNMLKLFDGQFIINIEDEGGRINVNDCAEGQCQETLLMLEALMSCPAEKVFLEKKNLTGRQLAYRILDWVDKNRKFEADSGLNDEDDAYQKHTPPYSAKNVPFDSLDELKLIEGWDDDIHAIFSPYLTIYPFRKSGSAAGRSTVNINTAKKELLKCLIPESSVDCREKSELALQARSVDNVSLAEGKAQIAQTLKETFCHTPEDGAKSKTNWFSARSNVFRIEAMGNVGDQEKKLIAVIERGMPDKAKKIDSSYKLLYWRML